MTASTLFRLRALGTESLIRNFTELTRLIACLLILWKWHTQKWLTNLGFRFKRLRGIKERLGELRSTYNHNRPQGSIQCMSSPNELKECTPSILTFITKPLNLSLPTLQRCDKSDFPLSLYFCRKFRKNNN